MNRPIAKNRVTSLLILWMIVNSIGWGIGISLTMTSPLPFEMIGTGAITGAFQFCLLRKEIGNFGWLWIIGSAFGWYIAWTVQISFMSDLVIFPFLIVFALVGGSLGGMVIGIFQWIVIRKSIPHALSLIPLNLVGFSVGLVVYWILDYLRILPDLAEGIIGGSIYSIFFGRFLKDLVKKTTPE